ncbi:helix-turn-helix domain-containing protein [Corynebacterium sp.]|uniref:helix-turn-helix domain-containing protein n=1 Tax=Corynebacterium sp. TaxID=1720 RepID=UPI003B3AA0B4
MAGTENRRSRTGEALAEARVKAHMTQAALAEKLNDTAGGKYSQPVIARIERGTRTVSVDELIAWSEAVGADPARVMEKIREPSPEARLNEVADEVTANLDRLTDWSEGLRDLERRIIRASSDYELSTEHVGHASLIGLRQVNTVFQQLQKTVETQEEWLDLLRVIIGETKDHKRHTDDPGRLPDTPEELIDMVSNSIYTWTGRDDD